MNDDGSDRRILARANRGSENPAAPSWSPDGRRIAAENGRGCDPVSNCTGWSVSIIDVRSGKRLASIPWGREPSWSPDGRTIAYTRGTATGDHRAKSEFAVWLARPDGRGQRKLVVNSGLSSWAPRGRLLAFFGRLSAKDHNGLHVIRPDGSGLRLLARSEQIFAWSPEGKRLAYVGPFLAPDRLEVLSLASGRRHQVAAITFSNPGAVAWSPDGTKIAFVRYDYGLDGDRLLIVPADGSAPPREIAHTGKRGRIWTPVFSKDGRRVLYSAWFLH